MSRAVFLLFLASLIAVFAGLVWADAYRQRATGSQVTGAVYARYGAGPRITCTAQDGNGARWHWPQSALGRRPDLSAGGRGLLGQHPHQPRHARLRVAAAREPPSSHTQGGPGGGLGWSMADDDLEAELLGYVLAAHLPAEEPIMAWWRWAKQSPTRAAPEGLGVRIRAHDHALLSVGASTTSTATGAGLRSGTTLIPARCGRSSTSPTGPASPTWRRRWRSAAPSGSERRRALTALRVVPLRHLWPFLTVSDGRLGGWTWRGMTCLALADRAARR